MNATFMPDSTSSTVSAPLASAGVVPTGVVGDGFVKVLRSASTLPAHVPSHPVGQHTPRYAAQANNETANQATQQSAALAKDGLQSATVTAGTECKAGAMTQIVELDQEFSLAHFDSKQAKTGKTSLPTPGGVTNSCVSTANQTQIVGTEKSVQTKNSSKVGRAIVTSKNTQKTAAVTTDGSALTSLLTTSAVPIQPNKVTVEASLVGNTLKHAATAESATTSDSMAEKAELSVFPSRVGDTENDTSMRAVRLGTVESYSPADAAALEPSHEMTQGTVVPAGDNGTGLMNAAELTAIARGLNDKLTAVTAAETQAGTVVANGHTRQAAERSTQLTTDHAQKQWMGIKATGHGMESPGGVGDESAQRFTLDARYASLQITPKEHSTHGATEGGAHKDGQTHQASAGMHTALAPGETSKTEKLNESITTASNSMAATATVTSPATVKLEATTTSDPMASMATATNVTTATNSAGTSTLRGAGINASAETRLPTAGANQSSTLEAAQLHTTASGTELKVSVQVPELGRVEVRAVSSANGTLAHVTTQHHDAITALSEGREGLEAALRTHDVALGSLTSQAQSQGGQQQGQAESHRGSEIYPNANGSDELTANTSVDDELPVVPEYASISVRA